MWSNTTVGDSIRKQFIKEKGDKMSALSVTVGGLSVDMPVCTARWALDLADLSGSNSVLNTISLERLVSLAQTLSCLVGQQLDKAVCHEKMSSDVESGAGSGNMGRLIRRHSLWAQ